MVNETSQIEQRIKRYWYIDGFGELIGGGGMFLILALYFTAQQYFGEDTLIGSLLQAGLWLVIVAGVIFVRRIITAMKRQITYPRTGYVEYREKPGSRVLAAILAAGTASVLAAAFVFIVRRFDSIDSMVGLTGVLVAVILFVKQVWSTGVKRFYALSAFSLALGIFLSVDNLAQGYNLGLFYGLMSLAFAISGGLTLKKYLRENPIRAEADNG
jgi:hypothetical protein